MKFISEPAANQPTNQPNSQQQAASEYLLKNNITEESKMIMGSVFIIFISLCEAIMEQEQIHLAQAREIIKPDKK